MYRIACIFEPNHPKIAGRTTRQRTAAGTVGHVERRGVWRVHRCWPASGADPAVEVNYIANVLWVLCPTTRQRGALCNPRRILAEYQDARRLAQAVNRVGAWPQAMIDAERLPVLTDVVQHD